MIKKKHAYILTIASILVLNYSQLTHAEDTANNTTKNESSTAENIILDSAITTAIKSKYLADADIKALDIHVETINGKVILTGVVPNSQVREKAISIAKDTSGVKEVISQIKIK